MDSGKYPAWGFLGIEGSIPVWESTEGHSPCAAGSLTEPHHIVWKLVQECLEPQGQLSSLACSL